MNEKPQWLQNEEMRACFDSLPCAVQENIMQCALNFQSVQELRACAKNMQTL